MSNAYRDRLLSVGHLRGGQTGSTVKEGRRADGVRTKATTDELGNTVTEHASKDDRVDVAVRPNALSVSIAVNSEE